MAAQNVPIHFDFSTAKAEQHSDREKRLCTDARIWMHDNAIDSITGIVPTNNVINSLQCVMLDMLTEAMVLIAQNSQPETVWDNINTLAKLRDWSDEHIQQLGEIQ